MLKSFPKILTIFFLIIFIFQLACLAFLFAIPRASLAGEIKFTPQVQLSDYTFDAKDTSTGNIARYVRAIYKYAIGIVGILAAVVLMIGGVMWIVAGGNATAIGEAKAWIGASLTGLLLALMSYLILATVNPALVDFKTTSIQNVTDNSASSSCCEKPISGGTCSTSITQNQCKSGYWKLGAYICNSQGNCVDLSTINICCVHKNVTYDYVQYNKCNDPNDTRLSLRDCCNLYKVESYNGKTGESISNCNEIPATKFNSETRSW